MESIIDPIQNPELSIKGKYDKRLLINLDEELFNELKSLVEEKKGTYNSVSHYIRCAVIQKLRPKDNVKEAYNEGYKQALLDVIKKIEGVKE